MIYTSITHIRNSVTIFWSENILCSEVPKCRNAFWYKCEVQDHQS